MVLYIADYPQATDRADYRIASTLFIERVATYRKMYI